MSTWSATQTADGRTYYWNKETKVTTWDKPDDYDESAAPPTPATPAADPAAIDASWKEAKTGEGRPYYYNAITKVTRWDAPEAFTRLQQQQQQQPQQPPARQDGGFVAGGGHGYDRRDDRRDDFASRDRRIERRDERNDHLPQKPSFDGGRGGGNPWENRQDSGGFRGPMPTKTDEPEYATPEQAEEAFFKLLRRHNVTPETSWEEALRTVVRERDYRAIKDPRDRRLAFEKYCVEVRAQEKGKEKERRERLREEFRKMLGTHEDIKHYTRWRTARPSIEREAVFKQAGNEEERRQMFDEYIVELKRRHVDDEREKRKSAMQELDRLLKAVVTDPDTSWSDAQENVTKNERFVSEDIFRSLHTVDILNAFDLHVNDLNRVRNDEKQKEKRLHTRRERQARDAFKQLLAQMLGEGKIKAGTKWQDFFPLIADDARFRKLVGTPGSSPLDLFWDVVEEEERKLRSRRNDALDVLEDKRYEMTTQTTVEDFAAVMRSDPRTADLSPEQSQAIYDRLMEKIYKRAEEEKLHAERSQRKAIDALRSIIKHLEPPVRLTDTYEDVAPRLASYEEYIVLDDDEARRSAFEKHMRRLKDKEQEDADRERTRRDRDRDHRNGTSRRDRGGTDDRDRRHRTRTPEVDAYESERRKAQADRERQYRKASFGLTPPPRGERRDDRERGGYEDRGPPPPRRGERGESIYDRERREREMERERNYISRADPRDKGRTLDYGDEDTAGSRPGSVRKRRESEGEVREAKRARRTRTPEQITEGVLKEEPPALQSGSEEGEIEEI